jgi:hypothetical protein
VRRRFIVFQKIQSLDLLLNKVNTLSTPFHHIYIYSILILSSHLLHGFPSVLFPTNTSCALVVLPKRITCHSQPILLSPWCYFVSVSVALQSGAWVFIARSQGRGFEVRSRHGCVSLPLLVVLTCEGRGLASDPPSKECSQVSMYMMKPPLCEAAEVFGGPHNYWLSK